MGDEEEKGPQGTPVAAPKLSEHSIPQLEEILWRIVTDGRIKDLREYVENYSGHVKFKDILNSLNEEYDVDGANIVIQCVKEGRDKGNGKGATKDHYACLSLICESGANVDGYDKAKNTALSWAVMLKYNNYVSKLLSLGAKWDLADQNGASPWHLALQKAQKDLILIFIDFNPQIVNFRDKQGVPSLVSATKYGNADICRLLLEKGADVNAAEDRNRRTSVYHAIHSKNITILDTLLKYKPKLDTIDSEGRSILYLCCESKDIRFYHKIIAINPHFSKTIMESRADDDKTAVIVACQNGNSEQLKHLLDDGASVTAVDVNGKTGLHYCADNLVTQCAEMLLDKDDSVLHVKDEQGHTALALSVLIGNTNLMKLLLDKGADIDTEDEEGHKLAHWAAVTGHLKVLDLLIQYKADFTTADGHNAYPIHYAAQMNRENSGNSDPKISEKVLKKVIDCKVKLDVVDDAGRQPLLWAACSGNAESCKLLLKAGADINSQDKDDLTAAHCAASRGHAQCLEVLRKQGADCNIVDKNKCTPLFYAITLGNKSCTKALITAKSDVNHVDDRGRNPAHCAAIKGCLDTMKMLEKDKADLWHQNNKGDYPIHEAAQKGHLDVVKYLLRSKNDKESVNVTNKAGKTLLHIAAATNNLPLCKLLINHDCDKNALMKHAGKEFTPYDLAVIKGYQEAADYLKVKGAQPYADLSNVAKRESKSARKNRENNIETVPEGVALTNDKNTKKSPVKDKGKSPEKGRASPEKGKTTGKGAQSPTKGDKTPDNKGVKGATAVATATAVKGAKDSDKTDKDKTDDNETKEIEAKTEEKSESKASDKKGAKGASPDSKKSASPKGSDTPKLDKAVGIEKATTASNTEDNDKNKDKPKKVTIKKKPSAENVLDKEDGIRTSQLSLQSEESPFSPNTKNAGTQKNKVSEVDRATSATVPAMGNKQGKTDANKEKGKYVSLEKIEPTESERGSPDSKKTGRKSRVGFDKTDRGHYISDNDSGNETDPTRQRTKRVKKKPYVNSVRDSVRKYQDRRNQSRSMQQLKRAQIHTGPMHDIVMFSKMMDNYRRGMGPDEEEMDLRAYANWDGYLNDQLRFVSHLYGDESQSPRDIQETAKEHHKMMETEANNRKHDADMRCEQIDSYEEKQRKRNVDMDKEINHLATRTAEMFDNVKTGASSDVTSAKTRNQKLTEEMRRARDEKIQNTDDPKERAFLESQRIEDEYADRQHEIDLQRKERSKVWHHRKDEEMRRRLLQAYRPYFPQDVFTNKSVCLTGGRVKSAGRLHVESASPRPPRRSHPSPRPTSHTSDSNQSSSVAQYKLKEDKTQVQMTPYGLRRVRNQERPTYEDVEDELAEAIFFNAPGNRSRCTRSADTAANWSRKYNGSIRPRTGLVFVEPRVYDGLMKEEKDAKRRISSDVVRHNYTNGDIFEEPSHPNHPSPETNDSILS